MSKFNLHAFADASKDAYCATVFLVCQMHYKVTSNLVAAKTRLAPMKRDLSIPRLELTAARVYPKLLSTVIDALSAYKIDKRQPWSDSTTVLHWLEIRGRYKQFVSHRVKEIQELVLDITWK